MSELAKAYLPGDVERAWYQRWLDAGCFRADEKSSKPKYSMVIPPPNVTGSLTMGHVLNNTIQDILARRARMTGHEVLWMPGTDHAGIATQNVVEKTLKKAGEIRHRDDLGRDALVARIWEWKEEYGDLILKQLRALGASCDWSRTRFTMDPDYSRCVHRVFVDLYKKGLIYRGTRMVNWCPGSLTALSDEEVIMKEQKGLMYHFRVEVAEQPGTFLTIATTRPETIPADTAVAVNPKDPRYQHLIGKQVVRALPPEQPREQRLIPIIADEQVDFEFGTGVLKVTPAHDKTDYEIGLRHKLPLIDVLTPDARMTADAGTELVGLDRFAARKKAAELLEAAGALDKTEPYTNNVGFSERADVPIEPRLSEQWFLKYPSVEQAHRAVSGTSVSGTAGVPPAVAGVPPDPSTAQPAGTMRFFPDRWAKVYDHWMTGIQDWCISRQLWWGHRIPVWTRMIPQAALSSEIPAAAALEDLGRNVEWGRRDMPDSDAPLYPMSRWFETSLSDEFGDTTVFTFHYLDGKTVKVEAATISAAEIGWLEGHGFSQDPDVLDTWFSSWLWPFATMGWIGVKKHDDANPTLTAFYPTTDLVTAPDIIFFWVARMIMAGFEYMGAMPFRNVYFTGIIRDKQGRKMSKSLGNSPDPLELIEKYGADGLRFGLLRIAPTGMDVKFDETQIEEGRNFANKLWNACRYRQMQGARGPGVRIQGSVSELTPYAIDILAKLDDLQRHLAGAFAEYEFGRATSLLYEYFWGHYCDLFLETIKGDASSATLATQDTVLCRVLLLLHPFMPHITEELWATMGCGTDGEFLMLAQLPVEPVLAGVAPDLIARAQREAAVVYATAARARNLKAEYALASRRDVTFVLKPAGEAAGSAISVLRQLAGAAEIALDPAFAPPPGTPVAMTDLGELFLPLAGLIDVAAERIRLTKELAKVDAEIQRASAKLASSPAFADKAPPEVVAKAREGLDAWRQKHSKLSAMLANLG